MPDNFVMRLPILKRRSEFLAVKSGASWGTSGFLLQAKLRPLPLKNNDSSLISSDLSDQTHQANFQKYQANFQKHQGDEAPSGPRFGITVTKQTVRRYFLQNISKDVASGGAKQGKKPNIKTDARRGPISVLRNKMRRRLKEALLRVSPAFAKPGVDYVIIGRGACLSLDFEILIKDLEKSFQKVHRRIIPTGTGFKKS